MKLDQLRKILKIMIIAALLMMAFDLLFWEKFGVSAAIESWIESFEDNKWLLGVVIWFVMFIQVTIVPIPAMVVLNAAVQTGIIGHGISAFGTSDFWAFVLITVSAYMFGAIAAYWLGKKFGKKAVKYCAGSEEDYQKWATILNKKGRWWYAATVIFPIFPDDLICIVAGSVKFDFQFFFWSNLVGRTVGLLTVLLMLTGVVEFTASASSSIPWSTVIWAAGALLLTIAYIIVKIKERKERRKIEK